MGERERNTITLLTFKYLKNARNLEPKSGSHTWVARTKYLNHHLLLNIYISWKLAKKQRLDPGHYEISGS